MDKLVSLCKRRGFIFQSSEIYGGTGSVWDYGPLGVELKKNLKDRWWRAMVRSRDDIEGLDAAILMHPRVWEASGHVAGFVDPLVDCRTCKGRFRADKLEDARCPQKPTKHPGEHSVPAHRAAPVQPHVQDVHGAGRGDGVASSTCGPETAQGIFVNFLNVQQSTPAEGAVRHRADRQGVPQRDHAGELHLPHARVRADGDAVLRRAGHGRWSGSSTGRRSGWSGTTALGLAPERLRYKTHERARALRARRVRHRVRLRRHARLPGDRGDPQPRRTSISAGTRSTRARSSSTSTSRTTSATCRS